MKYIVETIGLHRHVHVVEAETKDEAFRISELADPNWEEYLGQQKISIEEYSESRIQYFKDKQFYWDGTSKLEDGEIAYIHPKTAKVTDEHGNQI
jgi:hypothetical protein